MELFAGSKEQQALLVVFRVLRRADEGEPPQTGDFHSLDALLSLD